MSVSEPALIQQQRAFVRAVHHAAVQRVQEEQEARERLDRELQSAEAANAQARRKADAELGRAFRALKTAEQYLPATASSPPAQPAATPPPHGIGGDPAAAMRTHADEIEANLVRIQERMSGKPGGSLLNGVLVGVLVSVGTLMLIWLTFLLGAIARGDQVEWNVRGLVVMILAPIAVALLVMLVRTIILKPYVPEEDVAAIRQSFGYILYLYQAVVEDAQGKLERRTAERRGHYEQAVAGIEQSFRQQMLLLEPERARLIDQASASVPEWGDPIWQVWKRPTDVVPINCLGELQPGIGKDRIELPALVAFPDQRSLLFEAPSDEKERALRAIQSLLLRLVANSRPGQVRFIFVDPLSQGKHLADFVHLADRGGGFITQRAWIEPRHIDQRLIELNDHIETTRQKLVDSQYASLREYNARVTPLAEPYRVLVVLDFPTNFTATSARRLAQIVELGPPSGVYSVVLVDTDQPVLYGVSLTELKDFSTVIGWDGTRFVWHDEDFRHCLLQLEQPPRAPIASRILQAAS